MTIKSKPTHGGKRTGSGRRPKPVDMKFGRAFFTLPRSIIGRLNIESMYLKQSKSSIVADALDKYLGSKP